HGRGTDGDPELAPLRQREKYPRGTRAGSHGPCGGRRARVARRRSGMVEQRDGRARRGGAPARRPERATVTLNNGGSPAASDERDTPMTGIYVRVLILEAAIVV